MMTMKLRQSLFSSSNSFNFPLAYRRGDFKSHWSCKLTSERNGSKNDVFRTHPAAIQAPPVNNSVWSWHGSRLAK